MESRNCQNCKNDFTIEPEDFSFYEKIKVPPPTFCPECRMIRRMCWRNERSLYKTKCRATNKSIVTCFSENSNVLVYDRDYWWSDNWDPSNFSIDFDFSKTFFEQYRDFLRMVPFPSVFNGRCENSPYSNHVGEMKNAYLTFASWVGENVFYSTKTGSCINVYDVTMTNSSELSAEILVGKKLFKVFHSQNSDNCIDSYFLYDCKNCSNCFGCTNLRNKNYCIWNKQYTKEEYQGFINKINLGSYEQFEKIKEQFRELKVNSIHKYANLTNSPSSLGDNMTDATNCKYCYDIWDNVKDCKYAINGGINMNNCYDGYGIGVSSDLEYEVVDSGDKSSNLISDIVVWNCLDVSYSINCHGSKNLFGCIGLRKKQYCIFNKQYTKDEYFEMVSKIKKHMNDMPYIDIMGRVFSYGDFFPFEISPFGYNETIAQENFPLSEIEINKKGFNYIDTSKNNNNHIIEYNNLPDSISDTNDNIVNEIISCKNNGNIKTQCTKAFRILKSELEFYRRFNLPLPRYCPNCRHYKRLEYRNPYKLWHRQCMKEGCKNEFETSYSPDRPEIVYCEKCYQQEVY